MQALETAPDKNLHLNPLKEMFINTLMNNLRNHDLNQITIWSYSFETIETFKGRGIQFWKDEIEALFRALLNSNDPWITLARQEGLNFELISQDINPASKPRVIDIRVNIKRDKSTN